jgi:hypothetical protein
VKPKLNSVSLVLVLEFKPQLVSAQMDTSRTKTEPVPLVLQNVKLVSITKITVLNVLTKELLTQALVHVSMDIMKPMNTVTNVLTNVPLVSPSLTVSLVPMIPEVQSKIVTVMTDISTWDKKPCVILVKSNVPLVLTIPITVPSVPQPESKDLNLTVIVVITNLLMPMVNVLNVLINVPLVLELMIIVPLVSISEDQPTLVHVQLDIMKLI